MAEAIVSVVLEQLSSVVLLQIQQEVKLVAGVGQEVRKLTSNFQSIEAVLLAAERRQIKETTVRVWLDRVKDVSYDMDDILDEWNTAIMKRLQTEGCHSAHNLKSKVCSYFLLPYSSLRQVILSYDIAFKIKAINERLDDIAKVKDRFNLQITTSREQFRPVESTSFMDESGVFGRDEAKKDLVSKLLNESSERQTSFHVISIVGMGGIGKTTLAHLAYNNKDVIKKFEKRIWVSVSYPFDALRIAESITVALGGDISRLIDLQSLLLEINKLIEGKKFLLVLDDVWTEDFTKWGPFFLCLKSGLHGSKVLVTTRNQTIAHMMESDIISIGELSDEQCWSIVRCLAFYDKTFEKSQELEDIGRKIASKCMGLPFIAKTMGSLLRFKHSREEWENILYSEMWEVKENIFTPLLLSYYDLPSIVKPCFTYCAIFPKGFEFEKDELIKLWMAQGYLTLSHNEEIEIIGEKCFDILTMRSFFQEFEKDNDGSISKCQMHHIVHDFAQFLSQDEFCMIEVKDLKRRNTHVLSEKAHQLMLMVTGGDTLPISICNFKKLRSLMINPNPVLGGKLFRKVIPKLFEELTSLRALEISRTTFISKEIGKLVHLRYLNLSYNEKLRKLPESLCELYNLQTLKLDGCNNLKVLPQGIGKLINLRHLMNYDTYSLRYMPKGIERLTKLRTLSEFRLSDGDYGGKACSLECFSNFQHIESLWIGDLNNSSEEKNKIIGFSWQNSMKDEEAILEAFGPPPNLKRLTITWYGGRSMSSLNRMTSLTNLSWIYLSHCWNCLHLPALGKLTSLETLYISTMASVREVGNEFVGVERDVTSSSSSSSSVIPFPKLKTLQFEDMYEWEVWDSGLEEDTTIMFMPTLHTLKLHSCPQLKGLPKQLLEKAPLQNLSIQDCPLLQQVYEKGKGDNWDHISHIPNIQIQVDTPGSNKEKN